MSELNRISNKIIKTVDSVIANNKYIRASYVIDNLTNKIKLIEICSSDARWVVKNVADEIQQRLYNANIIAVLAHEILNNEYCLKLRVLDY